jgi:hypothetical protein
MSDDAPKPRDGFHRPTMMTYNGIGFLRQPPPLLHSYKAYFAGHYLGDIVRERQELRWGWRAGGRSFVRRLDAADFLLNQLRLG